MNTLSLGTTLCSLIGVGLIIALIVSALREHKGLRAVLVGFVVVVATGVVISVVSLRTSISARNAALAKARAAETRAIVHAQALAGTLAEQDRRPRQSSTHGPPNIPSPTVGQDVLIAIKTPPHLTTEGLVVSGFVPLGGAPALEPAGAAGGRSGRKLPDPLELDEDLHSRIADKLAVYFEQLAVPPSRHERGLIDEVADSVERIIRDIGGDSDRLYELRAALRQLTPDTRRTLADQLAVEYRSDVCSQRFQTTDPDTGRATEVYASRITVPPHRIRTLADTLAAESRPRGATVGKLAVFTAGMLLLALILLKVATRRHRRRHGL